MSSSCAKALTELEAYETIYWRLFDIRQKILNKLASMNHLGNFDELMSDYTLDNLNALTDLECRRRRVLNEINTHDGPYTPEMQQHHELFKLMESVKFQFDLGYHNYLDELYPEFLRDLKKDYPKYLADYEKKQQSEKLERLQQTLQQTIQEYCPKLNDRIQLYNDLIDQVARQLYYSKRGVGSKRRRNPFREPGDSE